MTKNTKRKKIKISKNVIYEYGKKISINTCAQAVKKSGDILKLKLRMELTEICAENGQAKNVCHSRLTNNIANVGHGSRTFSIYFSFLLSLTFEK